MDEIATRIVVNEEVFRDRARERGFPNVESIAQAAKDQGVPLTSATVYKIFSGGNYQRHSLERLAQVSGISLEVFVSFQPQSIRHGEAGQVRTDG